MNQGPELSKVQGMQNGVKPNAMSFGSGANTVNKKDKEEVSQKLEQLKGQAGSENSQLKSLIEYLESVLGEKAQGAGNQAKLDYLTQKIKERSPKEQVEILKQVDQQFPAKENSSIAQTIKSIKKDILAALKDRLNPDQAAASLGNTKAKASLDLNSSTLDQVSSNQFVAGAPQQGIQGMARKPFEKSVAFLDSFAGHQKDMFDDHAFKVAEFAGTSDKSKAAYKLMREASQFWETEKTFLEELKTAGRSRDNNEKLQAALVELATLQVQAGSSFDADFANIETGKKSDSKSSDLTDAISEKKSEIKTLHSNLA